MFFVFKFLLGYDKYCIASERLFIDAPGKVNRVAGLREPAPLHYTTTSIPWPSFIHFVEGKRRRPAHL